MAIAVAQETCDPATGGMSGSGTTFASSSITVAAGSILVAVSCGVNGGGSATATTYGDSVNGSTGWSTAKDVANSPLLLSMGWRYFPTGQTVTVTATYNATCTQRGIKLLEVTGEVTPGALDGTPAGQFQLNVGTGADLITSGNLTLASQPALVIGACMNYGNNKNPAAGTGFTSTRVDWNTDVGGCRLEYKRVTATGSQAATYTGPSIDSWITITIAFDEATSGAAPPPLPNQTIVKPLAPRYARTTDFTVPPASGVFSGTGFPAPERVIISASRRRMQSSDVMPPMAVASSPRQPEALRALTSRTRRFPAADLQMAPFPGPVPVVGLRLWLRGDLGIALSGPNVVIWADQSGFGNDVTGSILYNLSSINGKPGLTFVGGTGMSGTTNILAGSSPRTIFTVSRQASSGGFFASLLTLRTSNLKADYLVPYASGIGMVYTDGVNAPNSALITPPHDVVGLPTIAEFQSAGAGTLLVYKENGVSFPVTQPSGSSTDSGTTGFTVGGGAGVAVAPFDGDIDEILVYDAALSVGDEAAVYNYLYARYFPGPPVQCDAPVVARRILRPPVTLEVLPPLAAPAPSPPPPAAPRAIPARARPQLFPIFERPTPPPPPPVVFGPTPAAPFVVRAYRRIVRWIFEVGWPQTASVPNAKVTPPLITLVDDVELTISETGGALVLYGDGDDLSIRGDT